MKDVFIVNPNSGRESQYHLMTEIKDHFQGKRIIIEKTKSPGHAVHIAQKYALNSSEPVHIFVCGGDGTLHEVVNGIAGCKHISLSIIPIGTGNDFIKSFGDYQKDDFLDLSKYDEPVEQKCDLLKINGEYAINTVSFGFDVNVAKHVNHFRDKIPVGGIIPYYVGMLASLSKPLTQEYKIQIDDKKYPNDKYTFVVFCNGKYYGGGYKPCPDALIDDGKIDVCMIRNVKRSQIVGLAKKYEKGFHVQYTDIVEMRRGQAIHMDTDNKDVDVNLDGEIRSMKNPTVEIVPSAIQLLLPRK